MEFRILGPLEVRDERGPVALGGIKQRAVLALLLLHPNEAVHAERIAVALWGEDAPASAAKTVQVYVSRLRKALGDAEAIVTTPAGYRLRVRANELDAERFARLAEDGRRAFAAGQAEHTAVILRHALALWRGPVLAELAFEPFAQSDIARLEEQRLATFETRVDADLAAGRHAELVGELRQLVAANPTRERLAEQLMLALYRCGQQADALDAFHAARRVLVDDIGVEPGPKLRELQQAVLAHDPRLDVPLTTLGPVADGAGALPAAPNVLLGREGDLDRVAALVGEARHRLVTLVGPGGVGKTRLAIEAARRVAPDFKDGARFVSLASITDPRDLASAIARALSTPIREGELVTAALRRFLGDRRVLLVLDNFEHLLAGAPLLSELLAACPSLTIVVTSRGPTRLAAERLYPVHPLDAPDADVATTAADLERYGAVAMFVDRVQAGDPNFTIDAATAPYVCQICRRLDGLPLALELAAARVGLLSLPELADRLDHALDVLTRGTRDTPERQRTLRATIDWSFGLLADAEPEAFTQFAVFASGATVGVAERVTGASLDTLHSLVDKQLLVRRGDRLLMLETVREYALERLAEHCDADAIHDRLATWCLRFTRQAVPYLVRADRIPWLARLNAELPNVLAALSWALDHERPELALELAGDLGTYWWRTSQWEAGLPWIDAALEQSRGASTRAQAQALLSRARLIGTRQQPRHRTDLQASLELFQACNDDGGISACLGHLANVEAWQGRFENAARLSDEAVRFAVREHDDDAIALALAQRVLAATDYDDASRRTRTAIEHLQRVGNLYEVTHTCVLTAYLAIAERRYEDALAWLTEASDAGRQLGDAKSVFIIRSNQGLAWLFLDDLDRAAAAFDDALTVCRAACCEHLLDEVLLGLAAVAARRGKLTRAARLAGAAKAHETASQAVSQVEVWSRLNDEMLTAPRHAYGGENWDRISADAASLTVYEAIDFALARGRFARPAPGTTARSQP